MACAVGGRRTCQRISPIMRGSTVELPAKCPGEDFVAAEAGRHRHFQYSLVGRHELGGRAREAHTLRILLWSFTGKLAEGAVQVKSRPSGAYRQRFKRNVIVQASRNVAKQVKKVLGLHRVRIIGEAAATMLDVSCGYGFYRVRCLTPRWSRRRR